MTILLTESTYQFLQLFRRGVGQQRTEVLLQKLPALFGAAVALAGGVAVEAFGGGQQRPAPAVAVAVAVLGIDKILSDNAASHLQARDVAIEAAAHLGTSEATGGAQLARNHTAIGLQYS